MQNDSNNHTNGFMTEFSYVTFDNIFLLPKCLLEYKSWQNLCTRLDHKEELEEHDTKESVFLNRTFPHETLPHEITLQPDPRQNNEHWRGHILGGSFSMDIPLIKKHGVIHLGRLKPGRISVNVEFPFYLRAFNQLNMSK